MVALPLTTSFPVVLLLTSVLGIGLCCTYLPGILLLCFYFTTKRPFVSGVASCGSALGGIFYAEFIKIVTRYYTFEGVGLLIGGLLVNCIAFCALYRPLPDLEILQTTMQRNQDWDETSEKEDSEKYRQSWATDSTSTTAADITLAPFISVNNRIVSIYSMTSLDNTFQFKGSQPRLYGNTLGVPNLRKDTSLAQEELIQKFHTRNDSVVTETRSLRLGSGMLYNEDIYAIGHSGTIPNTTIPLEDSTSCLPKPVYDVLHTTFDKELFSSSTFLLLCAHTFLVQLSWVIPFVTMNDLVDANLADWNNITMSQTDPEVARRLGEDYTGSAIVYMGITNLVARIFFGFIMTKFSINALLLTCGGILISAVSFIVIPFIMADNPVNVYIFAAIIGFWLAPAQSARTEIVIAYLGMEKLTAAMGMIQVTQGVAQALSPPLLATLLIQDRAIAADQFQDSVGVTQMYITTGCIFMLAVVVSA